MIDAFSTRSNRVKSLILLVVCVLSAIASVVLGINDNLPGILLALFAATVFVLVFAHPWRTTRNYLFLWLESVLGLILFLILNIIFDLIVHNPATSVALQNLIQSPTSDTLNVTFVMICLAAFLVGMAGSVVMFIRGHRQIT